jgi:hypothetical protein
MNNNYNMKNNNAGGEEDSDESGSGWISWFCDLEGHEFFIEVSVTYSKR